jgi:hypothetical protein
MSRKGRPWLRPSLPALSSPTKVTTAMPWSTSSRPPVPKRSSRLEAIATPNATSTGTATRHETSSSDFSIASSSSAVSQPDTTNLQIDSTPSCILLVPISGYCEHALESHLIFWNDIEIISYISPYQSTARQTAPVSAVEQFLERLVVADLCPPHFCKHPLSKPVPHPTIKRGPNKTISHP